MKASENTYKSFREWIEATYKNGEPDEDEWMEIIDQDIHSDFNTGRWGSRDMQLDPATEDDDALTESPRHWTED
ncbi:MAG: hypothetical protein MJE68_22935 [Proteobacteria bacterium]|nr:hypothetical protein [Pseudomonadota bacterium]